MNTTSPRHPTDTLVSPPTPTPATSTPAVEIVIPVHNEEQILNSSVRLLRAYLQREFNFAVRITVADNASTDRTLEVAQGLARELPEIAVLHLERKGRGRALRAAWSASEADVLAYMDVDLSSDLAALPGLLLPLLQARADIAIGSRLAPGAEVTRKAKRELISRSYNLLLRNVLGVGFSDAQCGFKAGRREVIQALLDEVQDDSWFFDTELLYLAERSSLTIHEVPVRWVEDPDSRVDILATAWEDVRGVLRLRRRTHEEDHHRRGPGSAPTPATPRNPQAPTHSRRGVSGQAA